MDVPVLLVEFEGVVADTAAMRSEALAEALAADGIALNDRLLRLARGQSTENAVRLVREAVGAPDDATAIELGKLRAERAFAARAGKGVSLAPGAKGALEKLGAATRLALVTRASRREVEFVLGLAGFEGLFRPIITLEDVTPGKPDRAPYVAAMSKVALLFPGQTLRGLAVEDTLEGARGARAAGLPVALIGDIPPHEAMEADAWFDSIASLTPERVRALLAPRTEKKQ
jgi:beta-phosphoglucomutase-like phosphatase (HAD superfamily)